VLHACLTACNIVRPAIDWRRRRGRVNRVDQQPRRHRLLDERLLRRGEHIDAAQIARQSGCPFGECVTDRRSAVDRA
jgi:hypothetical protein